MLTVTDAITVAELTRLAEARFGGLVKAVVDVRRGLMVVDADMHADEEAALLDVGTPDFVEFDSMINIRPSQGNRTRSVDDQAARAAVEAVIARLVRS
jgi:putative aminopeptidase FrvX